MKKLFIAILVAIAGVISPAVAQSTTDITSIGSILYSEEMTTQAGKQLVLPVYMKNAADVTLFQSDIYIPEGFSFAKKTNGRYAVSLDKTRLTDEDDDHSISGNIQADGALRVLCSSQSNLTFDGNDGKVATVTIDVAEDVADGQYIIKLNNQKLVRPNNTGDNISEYQVVITVKTSQMHYDVNGDGKVDIADVTALVDHLLGK